MSDAFSAPWPHKWVSREELVGMGYDSDHLPEPCDTPEKELHARGECDFGCVYCEAEADDRREAEMPRTRLEWIEATHDENDYPHRGQPE